MWRHTRSLRRLCTASFRRVREERKKEAKEHQNPKGWLKIWEAPTEHPAKRVQKLDRRASERELEKFAKRTPRKEIPSQVFPYVFLPIETLECSLRLKTDYLVALNTWDGKHHFANSLELFMAALTHGSFVHHVVRRDHYNIAHQSPLYVLGAFTLQLALLTGFFPQVKSLSDFSNADYEELRMALKHCDSLASPDRLTNLALSMNLPFLIRRFPADPRAVAGKPPVTGLSPTEYKGLNSVLCESLQALVGTTFLINGMNGAVEFVQSHCNPQNTASDVEQGDVQTKFLSSFTGASFDARARSRILVLDPERALHDLLNRLRVWKKQQDPKSEIKFDIQYRTIDREENLESDFAYLVSLECGEEILATGAAASEIGARKAAARALLAILEGESAFHAPMDEGFHPCFNDQVPKPGNYSSRASAFRCLKLFESVGLVDAVSFEMKHSRTGSGFLRLGSSHHSEATISGVVQVGSKSYTTQELYETESKAKDAVAELALRDVCSKISVHRDNVMSSRQPNGSYISQFKWLQKVSRFYGLDRHAEMTDEGYKLVRGELSHSHLLKSDEKSFLAEMPNRYLDLCRRIGKQVHCMQCCTEYIASYGLTGWQEDIEKSIRSHFKTRELETLWGAFQTTSNNNSVKDSKTVSDLNAALEVVIGCLYLSRGCDETVQVLHRVTCRNVAHAN
eukprot:jgi/Galph1/2906/GphlegSOOS_G1563.1